VTSNKNVVIVEQNAKQFGNFSALLQGNLTIPMVESKSLEGAEGTRRMSDQFLPIIKPLDGLLGYPFTC
jgi:hypothetical protein